MKAKTIVVISLGVAVTGVALWLALRKRKAGNAGNQQQQNEPPADQPGNNGSLPATPAAGGNKVYSNAGLTIRTSPEIEPTSEAFWIEWGGNVFKTVERSNVFVGTITGSTIADKRGEMNQSKSRPYNWYPVKLSSEFNGQPGEVYYVREDYITIK